MTSDCFDQTSSYETFTEIRFNNEEFASSSAHQKWAKYFENSRNGDCHSELLKISQTIPVILPHNAKA